MPQNSRNESQMIGAAVIFDLDGTLLDTLVDLAETTNLVLEQVGCPQHSVDRYRFLVGDGVGVLFERALPSDCRQRTVAGKPLLQYCVDAFHQQYATRWDLHSGPYPGIPELLDRLVAANIPFGVLSNKPHAFTVQCVAKLLSGWDFKAVLGQREGVPRKPDPTGVFEMLQQWNVAAENCLYVGDTNTDMQTGRAAGCITIGVSWGFRPVEELLDWGAHYIVDQPIQLLEFLAATKTL